MNNENIKNGTGINSREAFELMFHKYYHPLVLFANRYVRDHEIAEDIVQTFFCNFWEQRQKLMIDSSIKNYLFRSIKNSTLNFIKYDTRFVREEKNEELINELHQIDPIDVDELEVEVINALNRLTEREREIFLLCYKDGYSYAEIAEKLGISVNSVKTLLTRSRKTFSNKAFQFFLLLFC